MKAIGRLFVLGVIGFCVWHVPIVLAVIVLLMIGFNLAHGKAEWPTDYYRKSKAPVTWKQKINPWWWMLNDDDPVLPLPGGYVYFPKGQARPSGYGPQIKNDWFHPTWPQRARSFAWGWRNPTCNLDRYVLGFWDKQDWWARERHLRGLGKHGEMFPLPGERFAICAPFLSTKWPENEKGQYWEFYTGWKPNSEFGWVCLRRKG